MANVGNLRNYIIFFDLIYTVLRCTPLVAPPNGVLKPANCGILLGTKCEIECRNGYETKQPNPPKECDKSEDGTMYWTGEETNCTGELL